VLSVAIDARDSLLGTADEVGERWAGVRLRIGGTVSFVFDLFFADDDLCCRGGCNEEDFDFCSVFAARLLAPLLSFASARGVIAFLAEAVSLLLLSVCFDEAVEPDDEGPPLGLGLVEVVTTVSLEEVLPRRRDSWSNVLIVSDRDAFDNSMRDS
jgi:hypothetical protein